MDFSIAPRAGLRRYVTTSGSDTSGLNQQNQSSMAAWAAIIPAAASLVGSAINTLTGKANRDLQRETNQQNFQNMVYQNNWNREQWNLENKYNSPAAQSQRLREAGINPNMVFGNGSVSEAGSLQSAPVNAAVAPQMPYVGADIANGVYTGINAYNQSQLINAQTKEITERAHGLAIQNELDYATLINKIESSGYDTQTKKRLYHILDATMQDKIAVEHGNVVKQQAETQNIIQHTASMKIHSDVERDLAKSNIKLNDKQYQVLSSTIQKISHEIALIDAQKNMTDEQKLEVIEKRTSLILDNEMKGIDNNIKNQLKDTIINSEKATYNKKLLDTFTSPSSGLTPWLRMENRYLGF